MLPVVGIRVHILEPRKRVAIRYDETLADVKIHSMVGNSVRIMRKGLIYVAGHSMHFDAVGADGRCGEDCTGKGKYG